MYCCTPELWAFKVLPDTKHGVPRETIGTHTENVESRTIIFQGGGTYTYSGGRGHLLPDWPIETGCPYLSKRFPWWGHYYQRAHRLTLRTRYRHIGEENPHQGSDRPGSKDCSVHHVEGGRDPRCTLGFQGTYVVCSRGNGTYVVQLGGSIDSNIQGLVD